MKNKIRVHPSLAVALLLLFTVPSALAHVTISPRESTAGASETYTIRVPNERGADTVRIEMEIPMGVSVSEFEPASGWQIESTMGAEGNSNVAVWSGGSIAVGESQEFSFSAQNPDQEITLVWKVVQIRADGSRAEWIGERGSSNPAPMVELDNQ